MTLSFLINRTYPAMYCFVSKLVSVWGRKNLWQSIVFLRCTTTVTTLPHWSFARCSPRMPVRSPVLPRTRLVLPPHPLSWLWMLPCLITARTPWVACPGRACHGKSKLPSTCISIDSERTLCVGEDKRIHPRHSAPACRMRRLRARWEASWPHNTETPIKPSKL